MNPLKQLARMGQSIWLDSLRRELLGGGGLARLIEEDEVTGVFTNLFTLEAVLHGSGDYASAIAALEETGALSDREILDRFLIEDTTQAAEILDPVFEASKGRDGYACLDLAPELAYNTEATISEARRLLGRIGRRNVMVRFPATQEGIAALERLTAEGISVHLSLLCTREGYSEAAEAYLRGLEHLAAAGGDLRRVSGVAGLLLNRLDVALRTRAFPEPAGSGGKSAAVSLALSCHALQREIAATPRWAALAERGALWQRLLWAGTTSWDPALSDLFYPEELVARDTILALTPASLASFRHHGRLRGSEADVAEPRGGLDEQKGGDIAAVGEEVLRQEIGRLRRASDRAVDAIAQARAGTPASSQSYRLPVSLATPVETLLERWREESRMDRLWSRDASLWTGRDEARWMGWLGLTEAAPLVLDELRAFAGEIRDEGFRHAVVLGMGGSSLCADVLAQTFGPLHGFPQLHVLDSTDPSQIRGIEQSCDPARTLYIVSSKSGSTTEPNLLLRYFLARVGEALGEEKAGARFVAITDPGSPLEETARRAGFRRVFSGVPSVGGRYSALSLFGLVPAAVMGLDVELLCRRAEEMAQACAACVPVEKNPGAMLGLVLGEMARSRRDKVTFLAPPRLPLGAWLEQLLAESTGKEGKGIIPVDGELPGTPAAYGEDRLFVHLSMDTEPEPELDQAVHSLETAGQPVVRIHLRDRYDLGRELFGWEIATAAAGSVLGIHPFDQPDVEASKVATRKLTDEYEAAGRFPPENPLVSEDGLLLFADPYNAEQLGQGLRHLTLDTLLRAHLSRLGEGDYFAILAYLERREDHERLLSILRLDVRDARGVATCVGFGPRFLHSTGQAYKGGPDSGVFLQITADDEQDLPVPGRKLTFGAVKTAQARGDLQVLAERKRRALRVHLTGEVRDSLRILQEKIHRVLA